MPRQLVLLGAAGLAVSTHSTPWPGYVPHAVAGPGQVLDCDEPFALRIEVDEVARRVSRKPV